MVAIGKELRARGYDVVISLAEPYAGVAADAGLMPEVVIGRDAFDELLGRPEMWRPISGLRGILSNVAGKFLPLHWEVIRRHHRPGQTVLVSHPLDFASRTHRDYDTTTPLVSVHLAPSMLLDPNDPPRMSSWRFEFRRPAWAVAAAFWMAEHLLLHPCYLGELNAHRNSLGLAAVDRPMKTWWLSPDRIVLMYPDWFSARTQPLDSRFVHAGFPLADHSKHGVELRVKQPIVFTCGTAHHHSESFFRDAVQACNRLDRDGVLLTSHAENVPLSLPDRIQALGYVPLGELLRQSAAIVHHGGIGTTSQAFAAGVPQLIRPLAYDQFDNATRVEKLGLGRWLKRDKDLESQLRYLTADADILERCGQIKQKLAGTSGAARAADEIEKLVKAFPSSPSPQAAPS
jgi:rhamnosyltransferase subunit B